MYIFSLHFACINHFCFIMQALSTAVWSVLKAKRRMLKVNFKILNCILLSMMRIKTYNKILGSESLTRWRGRERVPRHETF